MWLSHLLLIFAFSISNLCKFVYSDRILGCNGFIKSSVPLDFNKIEIKLISSEGNLKDRIECAPNNGYFFVPIYDKGRYTLQVSSIYKWVFEPQQVEVEFDGVNDACSKGQDINFVFKGFRVFGKIPSIGERKGPKDVSVALVADLPTEQKEISTVLTDENGSFDISPVLPGTYIIRASHPRWRISKSLTTFSIEKSNYELPIKSLLFAGYDVSGSVVTNGEPVAGVYFILFSTSENAVESSWLIGCDISPVEGFDVTDVKLTNVKQLCHVTSSEKGLFSFPSVPSGNYVIVPFYRRLNSLKFDVYPRLVRFTVSQDSYIFSKPFQVSGFSIIGHVLSQRENGIPLSQIKVILDKEKVIETGKDGSFVFEGVKSGIHSIQIKSNDYLFDNLELKISPNTATLENIYPYSFKVCGNIEKVQQIDTVVQFVNETGKEVQTTADRNGGFCLFLYPGNYVVKVASTEKDPEKLLWFFPEDFTVKITDRPVKNINFQQRTAELVGSMECLDDSVCDDVNAVLRGLDAPDIEYNIISTGGKYKITDLGPGVYELCIINNENWCWETSTHKININKVLNVAPPFRRIGVSLTVSSSHDTKLAYKKLSANNTVTREGVLNIKQGAEQYCLPGDAAYHLEPFGCHGYAITAFRWELGQESLMLNAISHELTATVLSTEAVDDLHVGIYGNQNSTLKSRLGPLKPISNEKAGEYFVYKFRFQASIDEKLTLIPESSILLFTPATLEVHGATDCVELKENILAKRGIRLEGRIEPPLENVKISILNEFDEIIVSMLTNKDGKYKFMPLHSDLEYRVIGEKEGYLLSGPFEGGVFKAHKLAEIQVTLVDEANRPLQGVLLSLSGGENYRQTSQSSNEGKISFLSLKPSEYYLRPMLKEYKFSPPSKVVNIKEGKTVSIIFKGHRVLYSIFGSVNSLSHIPEKDVLLEAVSRAEGECIQHQEEGTTDESGNFRIRGLQPQCSYDIRLKQGVNVNRLIHKTLPESVLIKMNNSDVTNVNLVAILEATQCDVSLYITVDTPEHLRTIQLKLYDDDGNILHTMKLNEWKTSRYSMKSIIVTFPTLSLNNKNYYVQMDSTLSKSSFSYAPQTEYFTTNSTYYLLRMAFHPELKFSDSEIKHSYTAAIFILLLGLAYWCKDSLLLALTQLQNNSRFTLPEFLNKYSQQPRPKETEKTFIEFEPGLTVIKRKLKPRKM